MIRTLSIVVALACFVADAAAQNCWITDVGQRSLDDLRTHDYLGAQGGLYPRGSNVRPVEHEKDGIVIAKSIEPLDVDGRPDADGKVGFVSVGFSFCRQTFNGFLEAVKDDHDLASSLVLVNGAVPHMQADILADSAAAYWTQLLPQKVANAGLDMRQVQVVWMLTGLRESSQPFPDHAAALTDLFVAIVQNVKTVFPNAKICYVSSLYYLGYQTRSSASEPFFFEQGFAQKWLIERQIKNDPQLEWDARIGPVLAPWLAWGPYLWNDGEVPRSDGFSWTCSDVEPDGAHPSAAGETKLGRTLAHFLKSDLTATRWFLEDGAGASKHPADVELVGDGTSGTNGEPLISVSDLPMVPSASQLKLRAHRALAHGTGWFLFAFALLGNPLPFAGGSFYVEPAIVLPVSFDADGAGASVIGTIPDDSAYDDLVAYAQLVCLDPLGLDGKFALSSAIELRLGD